MLKISELKFDADGLIPAVVTDFYTKKVLTVAYMNAESLEISMREGKTCFYSRSRKKLWRKGENVGQLSKYRCNQSRLRPRRAHGRGG